LAETWIKTETKEIILTVGDAGIKKMKDKKLDHGKIEPFKFGIDFPHEITDEIKENFLTNLFHRGYIDRENYKKALTEFFGNKLKGKHNG